MVHNLPSFIDKISKKASFAATNVQTEGRQTWTILTWDASALRRHVGRIRSAWRHFAAHWWSFLFSYCEARRLHWLGNVFLSVLCAEL